MERQAPPMKRPLFTVGFSLFVALLAARLTGAHAAWILGIVAALLSLVTVFLRPFAHKHALLAVLLSAATAFLSFSLRDYLWVRPLMQSDGQTVSADLWIKSEVCRTEKAVAYYGEVRAGDLPEGTRLLLWVPDNADGPELYDRASARWQLTAVGEERADGVVLSAFAAEGITVTDHDAPVWAPVVRWRQRVLSRAENYAGGDVAALIRAVCFGERDTLSKAARADLTAAGLSHLTAVSGFHMSVLVMGAFALWQLLGLRRRWAAWLTLPVPVFFIVLCQFPYSALRAGGMCVLYLLSGTFRRRADAKNSLGAAVAAILLIDPNAIWDLGFLLSVSATLGILIAAESPTKSRLLGALKVSVSAVLATMPIVALTFGRLSVLSPLTNLIAEPLASVILVCGVPGTLLTKASFLSAPLMFLAGLSAKVFLWLAHAVAGLPFAVWSLRSPYLLVWASAAPLAVWLGWRLTGKRGAGLAALALSVTLLAGVLTHTIGMRGVTTLTVTHTENGALLLLQKDGEAGLVVTGDDGEAARNFLRREGIDRLAFLLYTTTYTENENRPAAGQVWTPETGGTPAVFDGCEARWRDGWLWLTVGETRILLCPAGGDAADLSAQERETDLLIFDHRPPAHAGALSAVCGVMACDQEERMRLYRVIPWGRYEIRMTDEEAPVIRTRGRGDCQY